MKNEAELHLFLLKKRNGGKGWGRTQHIKGPFCLATYAHTHVYTSTHPCLGRQPYFTGCNLRGSAKTGESGSRQMCWDYRPQNPLLAWPTTAGGEIGAVESIARPGGCQVRRARFDNCFTIVVKEITWSLSEAGFPH